MRVDPLYSLTLGSSLNELTGSENNLSSQLSSGLRVSLASDDPLAASESVTMGSAIAQDDAYVQAATGVTSKLQVADSALGSVVTQVTSAITLAVQGTNGTLDASNLQAIGQQMAGIRDEVVSLANSSYAGQYLFSGTSAAEPYTNDTSTTPATATYAGDANQQVSVTPTGQQLVTGLAGSAIFSASGADVLASLNRLVADFSSGTVPSTATADLNELRDGLSNVSAQRGVLDASLQTISQTSNYAQTEASNLSASQSSLVSADTASIATELSQNETQQQALIAVISTAGKNNLFSQMG
jgi:flagellar hook-associated protein 3 FlgL